MPWSTSDVETHKKGLTAKQKRAWVGVANSALTRCLDKIDGTPTDTQRGTCEASAIKQANAVSGNIAEGLAEDWASVGAYLDLVRGAFQKAFPIPVSPAVNADTRGYWVRDVLADHPDLGDSVVMDKDGLLYAVGYEVVDGQFQFSPQAEWVPVVQTYVKLSSSSSEIAEVGRRLNKSQLSALKQARDSLDTLLKWAAYDDGETEPTPTEELAETHFAESSVGHILKMAEHAPTEQIVPLHLDVALITPGWGNKRDNFYYPANVIKRDANIFVGTKMYESDHREGEKSTRTWVSTVKSVKGFTADGAPIAEVSVHNRDFAERLIALNADGLLGKMECSILADGTTRKGFEQDGRKGKLVEAITIAAAVDWVTKAGAGGHALALAENESQENTMGNEPKPKEPLSESTPATFTEQTPAALPAPQVLAKEKVVETLSKTHLPPASVLKLAEADYADEAALIEAVKAEVQAVKEATGSGRPFGQGPTTVEPRLLTERERTIRFNQILAEVGGTPVFVPAE